MPKERKQGMNTANAIKVVVKNRPTKKQASIKLKQLSELLSINWKNKDGNPLE